jgi:hypothetical protein
MNDEGGLLSSFLRYPGSFFHHSAFIIHHCFLLLHLPPILSENPSFFSIRGYRINRDYVIIKILVSCHPGGIKKKEG